MKWYVNTLEEIVIQTLQQNFDMYAFRSPDTGVWVDTQHEKKICAMGVHNSDLVTCHGLALNCNIDLTWFNHIVPCGIAGKGVTSLTQESNRKVTVEEVHPLILKQFEQYFNCTVNPMKYEKIENIVTQY